MKSTLSRVLPEPGQFETHSSRASSFRPAGGPRKHCLLGRAPSLPRSLRSEHGCVLQRSNTIGVFWDFLTPLSLLQHLFFLVSEKKYIILRLFFFFCLELLGILSQG